MTTPSNRAKSRQLPFSKLIYSLYMPKKTKPTKPAKEQAKKTSAKATKAEKKEKKPIMLENLRNIFYRM